MAEASHSHQMVGLSLLETQDDNQFQWKVQFTTAATSSTCMKFLYILTFSFLITFFEHPCHERWRNGKDMKWSHCLLPSGSGARSQNMDTVNPRSDTEWFLRLLELSLSNDVGQNPTGGRKDRSGPY
ncbi:uncharacterized protein LOC111085304 [Limulus polyphemus]|uniref:Uncharacterized protein LOC111085304 n=1 Tax=Limulus polyphemus TaxID=6850 RepID=A0ABM1S5R0_LIMPO|nr:uncharacterized protein LOC111085304 [Limulus polyphemus]